jgi:hypothetical protein
MPQKKRVSHAQLCKVGCFFEKHCGGLDGFLLKAGLEVEQIGLERGNLTHFLKKGLLNMKYLLLMIYVPGFKERSRVF